MAEKKEPRKPDWIFYCFAVLFLFAIGSVLYGIVYETAEWQERVVVEETDRKIIFSSSDDILSARKRAAQWRKEHPGHYTQTMEHKVILTKETSNE